MTISFGLDSSKKLMALTPSMREVLTEMAAIADAKKGEDFSVLETLRSREQMMINWGLGRTAPECAKVGIPARYAHPSANKVTWLADPFNSKHGAGPDGLSRACDLLPYPMKVEYWNQTAPWVKLWNLMSRALVTVNERRKQRGDKPLTLRWGRDWDGDGRYMEKGETDGPHFEIVG